jgi:hypothetical protein
VTIDKGRRKCGLKDGLLFGDQVGVYGQGFGLRIESRERALFAGQTQADGAFSNRDAKNRDLNSLQLRSLCTSTHPVSSCCVLSLGTRFCHDVVVLEQCFVVDHSLSEGPSTSFMQRSSRLCPDPSSSLFQAKADITHTAIEKLQHHNNITSI